VPVVVTIGGESTAMVFVADAVDKPSLIVKVTVRCDVFGWAAVSTYVTALSAFAQSAVVAVPLA